MHTTAQPPLNTVTRLASMTLDHIFMTLAALVFFIPAIVSGFSQVFEVSHESGEFVFLDGSHKYLALFGFALYFCKDSINGRSIAKRLIKLQVVHHQTGAPAGPLRCFIRNIFCILWPIEVLFTIANNERRLGDLVAGTRVTLYHPENSTPSMLRPGSVILCLALGYGLSLLGLQLLPSLQMAETDYSKTSYNEKASRELERLLADSLGQYARPDIRVYDSVNNSQLKYISTILRLRDNYIADEKSYEQLHAMTTSLIYSKYPRNSFTGPVRYVYKASFQFQLRTTTIGAFIR